MFEDSLFDSGGRARTKSPVTVAISFLVQSVAIGILILIPLVYTEALPQQKLLSYLLAPPAAPTPQPATPSQKVAITLKPRRQQELVQPSGVPEHAEIIHDVALPSVLAMGAFDPSAMGPVVSELLSRDPIVPPPPAPAPASLPERINVGGLVAAANLIYQPKPVYPHLAIVTRTQGAVRLAAVINKDGTIANLTVLGGHPLLIPAALEAVRQWRYQPTLLNNVPVEVDTTIDVHFVLGG